VRLGISCGGNHLTAAAREHRRSSSRLPRSGGSAGNRRAATIFTAATLCSLLALSSLAADRAQPLEPVIVTAPRAEATAQREPASVTPVFAEELEAAGIDDTRALRTYVPSLVVNQGGDRDSAFVSIRGLANAFVGPPAVGIYVDDVPYPDQRAAADVDLLDVDRVEVFRGSQVTRFGRYAEAGAIRITTRRPGQQVGGHASVRYGDFDTQVYQGAASGPLGRAAAFSLSGLESKRDGYIENRFLHTTLDDREQFAGRANLFLLPLSGLEIAFTGEADHAGEGPKALTLLDQPDPFEVRYDTRGHLRTDEYLAATRVAYTAPLWRIVSITARRSFAAERSAFDFDFSPRDVAVGGDNHRAVNWTEELRLSSPGRRHPLAVERWGLLRGRPHRAAVRGPPRQHGGDPGSSPGRARSALHRSAGERAACPAVESVRVRLRGLDALPARDGRADARPPLPVRYQSHQAGARAARARAGRRGPRRPNIAR